MRVNARQALQLPQAVSTTRWLGGKVELGTQTASGSRAIQ